MTFKLTQGATLRYQDANQNNNLNWRKYENIITATIVGFMCAGIIACGSSSDGNSPNDKVTTENTNFTSGNCGSTVISDYNAVVLQCKYISTESDVKNCKAKAQSFQDKYPNINCTALIKSESSVNYTSVTITPSRLQTMIDKLTALGY